MLRKFLRSVLLLLALCLALLAATACQSVDPLAESGMRSVLVTKEGKVTATAVLDLRTLEKTDAVSAYLYELLPGEYLTDGKVPIAECKVGHEMVFEFSLTEGERSRITSSFAVVLEDGTEVTRQPVAIQNPEVLANATAYGWKQSPKGLVASNVSEAFELGAMHVMLKTPLSALMDENGTLKNSFFAANDQQILLATRSSMQVSLTIEPDLGLSYSTLAKGLLALCEYYDGETHGAISALYFPMESTYDNVTLFTIANQALRASLADGRVYMISDADTVEAAEEDFFAFSAALSKRGTYQWGAAIVPPSDELPWTCEDDESLYATNFFRLSQDLFGTRIALPPEWFAVCDLTLPDFTPEEQAAGFAYTYRAAVGAGADIIFCGSHVDDQTGLYDTDGTERPLASVFESIDRGLSQKDLTFCSSIVGDAWDKQKGDGNSRTHVTGVANLGPSGLEEHGWIDFLSGDCNGFFGVNTADPIRTQHSATYSASVLYAWIDPEATAQSGVRRVFQSAQDLQDVTTLSFRLLAQPEASENCRLHLSLEGTTASGDRISYTGDALVAGGSWQTVTFQISSFTAKLNAGGPLVLSLTAEPEEKSADSNQEFVLWVHRIDTRSPVFPWDSVIPYLITAGGVTVVLGAVLLLYFVTLKKDRRARKRGKV